ncbi:hypothetical protein A3K86_04025 [Photobacterium jeanii]|uniref:Uncharacterized protein n=1 Tax=Photobacterium jeanii TaxID=858640 RepID=A0A178KL83_9GAMM|nr:hypothetical protein [Photobacterium jeanii]OAN18089.1 hypothetical protein A3K86_04025 [Photobacterium jeanii]PST92237.1 hypothetical protein C9I91_03415 [Photobacterium jeanii]
MPLHCTPLLLLISLLLPVLSVQAADDDFTYCHSYAGLNFPDYRALWNPKSPQQTELSYKALLNLATKSHDKTYLSELLSQIARTYTVRQQYQSAAYFLSQAALYFDDAAPTARGHYWKEQARMNYAQQDMAAAIASLDKAWFWAEQGQDDRLKVEVARLYDDYQFRPDENWQQKISRIIEITQDLKLKHDVISLN